MKKEKLENRKILVTGSAGFIGFHLVNKLLKETNWQIVGLDNINDYYDVNLKYARLQETGIEKESIDYNRITQSCLQQKENVKNKSSYFSSNLSAEVETVTEVLVKEEPANYRFIKLDLTDKENLLKLFETEQFDYVVNLAAQAGVRYSLTNPETYIQSNIVGFFNILEACRYNNVKHLVYAGSSSVYGLNTKMPLSTSDNVDHPVSLYAASKKSNELMAHTYSYLYNLPTTGLRFFTVYGPWGRPDMALFKFTKAILNDKPIDVYNNGNMTRDFTYIDDIIEGVYRVITHIPQAKDKLDDNNPSISIAPYKVYNIGNSSPVLLNDFIESLEKQLGKKAKKNFLPIQPGDVKMTYSDVSDLERDLDYKPTTKVEMGIMKFVEWYKKYFRTEV
ncbi:MAG: NAD-dependent epimerase [Ignavibacteria bacterium]